MKGFLLIVTVLSLRQLVLTRNINIEALLMEWCNQREFCNQPHTTELGNHTISLRSSCDALKKLIDNVIASNPIFLCNIDDLLWSEKVCKTYNLALSCSGIDEPTTHPSVNGNGTRPVDMNNTALVNLSGDTPTSETEVLIACMLVITSLTICIFIFLCIKCCRAARQLQVTIEEFQL